MIKIGDKLLTPDGLKLELTDASSIKGYVKPGYTQISFDISQVIEEQPSDDECDAGIDDDVEGLSSKMVTLNIGQ